MPAPVMPLGGAIKHEDTIEISWHFEANLSDLPPRGITLDAPGPVPLPGSWKFKLKYEDDGTDKIRVRAVHGSLPAGAFGRSVAVKLRFALVLGIDERLLHQMSWNDGPEPSPHPNPPTLYTAYAFTVLRSGLAADGRWSTSEQTTAQQYRCTLIFVRDLQLDTARSHHTPTADVTKALRVADSFHTWHADVCLRFRRLDNAYLELWTTSGLLATASDYYKTLLASGCAETVPSGSKHDFLVERDWSGCKTASCDSVDMEYQQIDVRETAYSTMNAVLLYLATGHIEFAPLKSRLEKRSHDDTSSVRALLNKHVSEHPKLPPPVSPKSVYRLAHLLQREELQQLALDALSTSLTIEGATHELFSPVSIVYADVRKIILDYVIKNWGKVQASESWNELSEKAMAGEIEGAAQISFVLLRAWHGKDSLRAAPEKAT